MSSKLIFVLSSLALYLVIAFFVILQAHGYKLDWRVGKIEETSSLLVSFYPKFSEIKIDGVPKKLNGNGPVVLHGLEAGHHIVSLSAPGYHAWKKDVFLTAGLVEDFGYITLIQKDIQAELIAGGIEDIKTYPRSQYGFMKENGRWVIFSVNDKTAKRFQFGDGNIKEIEELAWSPLGTRALLSGKDSFGNKALLLISFSALQGAKLPELKFWRQLVWVGEDRFLGLDDGNVYLYDLVMREQKKLASGARQFAWNSGHLYILNSDGLWKRNLSNARMQLMRENPFKDTRLVTEANRIVLVDNNYQTKLSLSDDGNEWRVLSGTVVAGFGGGMFYSNGGELWHLNNFGHSTSARFITRFSVPIQGVAPLSNGRVVVLAGGTVSIVNTNHGNSHETMQCDGELNLVGTSLYCQRNKDLYYLEL